MTDINACAECHKHISALVEPELMGNRRYHWACAIIARVAGRAPARRSDTAPAASTRTIATVRGIAVTFDPAGCAIVQSDGSVNYERFAPDCFDDSLARGPYYLYRNHEEPIAGRWDRVYVSGEHPTQRGAWMPYPALHFRFHVYNSALGRSIVAKMRDGAIRHCSIAFGGQYKSRGTRTMTGLEEITSARLTHIGLLDGVSPAWCETSCWLEQ